MGTRQIARGEDGYYTGEWDGRKIRYPSVTTAIGLLTDFSKVDPDVLQRACDFGDNVHKMIHYYETGKLKRETLDPILEMILQAWERCKSSHKIEVLHSEVKIVSTQYGFAGTLDIIATVRGIPGVIELKTRPYNPTTEMLQTAAYQKAYNESYKDIKARKRWFCGFNLEGNYKFFEIKKIPGHPDHLNVFLSVLATFKWKGVSRL